MASHVVNRLAIDEKADDLLRVYRCGSVPACPTSYAIAMGELATSCFFDTSLILS